MKGGREADREGTSQGYENKEGELEDQSKVRNVSHGEGQTLAAAHPRTTNCGGIFLTDSHPAEVHLILIYSSLNQSR